MRLLSLILCLFLLPVIVQAAEEIPLPLPRIEGSKSFDLEIDELNRKGLSKYQEKNFEEAREQFYKATSLARQLRDPSLGIVSYNLALSLHELQRHEEAVSAFIEAKRYARGNKTILDSELLFFHECGFNPSVDCKERPPAKMHIEGSN